MNIRKYLITNSIILCIFAIILSILFINIYNNKYIIHYTGFEFNIKRYDIMKEYEILISEKNKIQSNIKENNTEILENFYDPNNVTIPSNIDLNTMNKLLEGTQLQYLSEVFIECEKEYGINAVFLAGLSCAESYYGRSNLAYYYNNITSILINQEPKYFNSKEECLYYTADLLSNYYLKEGAIYYNGLSVESINIRYCPNDDYYWSRLVKEVIEYLKEGVDY